MMKAACCLTMWLVATSAPEWALQPVATLRVTSRLVEVPVTVFDSHNHYVDGIPRSAFQVREGGKPQEIKYFASTSDSISCAILLDTTGSMDKTLPHLKNSVIRFVDQLGANDSVAIYSFAETLTQQQDFTTDKTAAKRSVLKMRAGGGTALFDALTDVTHEIAKQPGKKAVVVFTDGDDNASVLTAQAAVARATKDGVSLYTIAEGEATRSPRLRKTLAELSRNTGGETYEIKEMKDAEEVFLRISSAFQHMYLISYRPPFEPNDGKWRPIEVVVGDQKSSRVRSKEGYFPN
jgi:VWFA-related protein